MNNRPIRGFGGGGKGGGQTSGAKEDKDTLVSKSYARVVDVLCEGEIEGFKHPDRPMADIILNGTPIENQDTRTYHDGTVTLSSFTMASTAGNFTKQDVNKYLVCSAFPTGSYIVAFVDSNHVTLNNASTAAGTNLDYVIGGTRNWTNFTYYYSPGTPLQNYLPGFSASENVTAVNVQVTKTHSWANDFTDPSVDAVLINIRLPRLQKQDTKTGDIHGTNVVIHINARSGTGGWVTAIADNIQGKASSGYLRTYRLEVSTWGKPFSLQVVRVTKDSTSQALANDTWVDSYTEIIYGKLRYPNSVAIGTVFDASQFSNIPTRGFHMLGLKIKIPKNYDPIARTYATSGDGTTNGTWDGTFKLAWTNNPAWCWFAMATNTRWGLGNFVYGSNIDIFSLYNIGKYCDQMVPDGSGGNEPRFTCNLYMQQANDAFKVLSDMMGTCRGMVAYWNGVLTAVQDSPPLAANYKMFAPSNVIGGQFMYSGTGIKARHNAVRVSWNDLSDMGNLKYEYVEDSEAIASSGNFNLLDIAGFGCTSRGQARRWALGALYMEKLLTDTVSFGTTMEGFYIAPGQIIQIQDPFRAGEVLSGRILGVDTSGVNTVLTLDRPVDARIVTDAVMNGTTALSSATANFAPDDVGRQVTGSYLTWPTRIASVTDAQNVVLDTSTTQAATGVIIGIGWKSNAHSVSVFNPTDGTTQTQTAYAFAISATGAPQITCVDFAQTPEVESVFMVTEDDVLEPELFRVISVQMSDKNVAAVTALQYNASLYNFIDFNEALDEPPISKLPPPDQVLPPGALEFQDVWHGPPPMQIDLHTSWVQSPDPYLASYLVAYRRGVPHGADVHWGNWILVASVNNSITLPNLTNGDHYQFDVWAINSLGRRSTVVSGEHVIGQPPQPPNIVGLEICGQGANLEFETTDVTFCWRSTGGNNGVGIPSGGGVNSRDRRRRLARGKEARDAISGFAQGNPGKSVKVPMEPLTQQIVGDIETPLLQGYDISIKITNTRNYLILHERIQSPTFTFTYARNVATTRAALHDPNAPPTRNLTVEVCAVDNFGQLSPPARLSVFNLPPNAAIDGAVFSVAGGVVVEWQFQQPVARDIEGALIYYSTTPDANQAIYQGLEIFPHGSHYAQVDNSVKLYWWVVVGDFFGLPYSPMHFVGASWPAGLVQPPVLHPPIGYVPSGTAIQMTTAETGGVIMYTRSANGIGGWVAYDPANPPVITANSPIWAVTVHGQALSIVVGGVYQVGTGCFTPSFDPQPGTYMAQRVADTFRLNLATGTAGAHMRVTTDGSDPDDTTGNGTLINASSGWIDLQVGNDQTVKAIAYKSGILASVEAVGQYTILDGNYQQVATPTATPLQTQWPARSYPLIVRVACATTGAIIWYSLDGRQPYIIVPDINALSVQAGTHLRLMATKGAMRRSNILALDYTIQPPPNQPVFFPTGGTYPTFPLAVNIDEPAPQTGAQIWYTLDGSDPSYRHGTSAPIPTTVNVADGQTLKAIVALPTHEMSDITAATYSSLVQVATPAFTLVSTPGQFPATVRIDCTTAGATILYTIDGTTPTHGDADHGTPLTPGQNVSVPASTPLKAMAYKSGSMNSDVQSQTWIAPNSVAVPTIAPNGGAFSASPQSVTLNCMTAGATIVYTLDGSVPSRINGTPLVGGGTISLAFAWVPTKLRAMAYLDGMTDSVDTSATFELNTPPPPT